MVCLYTSALFGAFLLCSFAFLFVVETFLVFLQPAFQIVRGFFEFVAIEQTTPQRFEERARANVIGELFVRLLLGAFSDADEEFLVKSCEPALDATQAQRTFARDG